MNRNSDRVYLREWRLAKGLTQPELAKRVGTVKSEISRLEKGTRRMTLDWMSAIATALGVTTEDLMTLPPMGFGAVSPAPLLPGQTRQSDIVTIEFAGALIGVGGNFGAAPITGDDWVGQYQPGDLMIYDKGKTSTSIPGLFVVQVDGEEMTRRITPGAKGAASMTCSNPDYPPMALAAAHKVLGRVVARVHRV